MVSVQGGPVSSRQKFESLIRRCERTSYYERRGTVTKVVGLVIESQGPHAGLADICVIESRTAGEQILAEVVGFRDDRLLLMPLGEAHGVQPGSHVVALNSTLRIPAGEALKGRVVNSFGQPLDSKGPIITADYAAVSQQPPHPLKRQRIDALMATGIKALDTFLPCGYGQRLGIFAGSGVGKSTLLGMMASQAKADVNVIALIGERGREVREFIERDLDESARAKSVVVVATSNEPALVRLKGAFSAMALAEYFRDQGKRVLLMMDSVTRFALAQREIGLAVGEPPATRGYTPSVFALLPQLLERAGAGERGSITGYFTVLVEGDDMNEPVADAVRSILDGHIVLSRRLASQNHYPAIDVLDSVSRLSRELTTEEQQKLAGKARDFLASYRRNEDLINIGAYVPGANADLDQAVKSHAPLRDFLKQGVNQTFAPEKSWALLSSAMQTNIQTGGNK
jgi:flagellum-specific ATP synthase